MSTCISSNVAELQDRVAHLEAECQSLLATRDQLRQSEAKWRALLDQSIDLITLLTPAGEVVEVNRTALDLVGLTVQQVIGRPWRETKWWTHSEGLQQRVQKAILRVASGGTDRFEANHPRPDGTLTSVDVSLKPIQNDQGELVYLIAEARDVTQQRATARAQERQRRQLEIILDHMPDYVWFKDTQGNILQVNKAVADSMGLEPQQFVGVAQEKFYPDQAQRFRHDDDQILQSGEPMIGYIEPLTIGNQTRWIRTAKIPVRGAGRHVEGIVVVSSDITELRHQQEELQARNEELQNLLGVVSHDLKSPLVTIDGFSAMLQTYVARGDYDKAAEAAARIQRGTATMGNLIDDLLELNRVGSFELRIQSLDTRRVAREVLDALTGLITATQAEVAIAESLPRVDADRGMLVQVLLNLVQNALKYGCPEPGGVVEIGGRRLADQTHLYVRDQGRGIAPEFQARIFRLFERLGSDESGTGLGLATVAKVMERHEGRVWVESAADRGATFWLSFPNRP